jgi:hypothetical protein
MNVSRSNHVSYFVFVLMCNRFVSDPRFYLTYTLQAELNSMAFFDPFESLALYQITTFFCRLFFLSISQVQAWVYCFPLVVGSKLILVV